MARELTVETGSPTIVPFMESFDFFPRGGSGQSNAAAERAVDATAAYFSARTVVALVREHDSLVPLAERGADRRVLDGIARAGVARRGDLAAGRALYGSASEIDPGRKQGGFVLAPIFEGEQLAGVLYVETDAPRFHDPKEVSALAQFCRMLGGALQGPAVSLMGLSEFLEQTPSDEVARQQLLTLLERHEWNIARVARAMRTTRTTIYNRLERYGVERRRVAKSVRRPRLA